MSDIHALSGAYAVDALDDSERSAFERHLASCAICSDEVDSLRETSTFLAATAQVPAPEHLRARVLAEVALTRPLAPLPRRTGPGSVTSLDERRSRRRPIALLVAAAAAVAAVFGGVQVVGQSGPDVPAVAPELSASERVLQAPDAEEFTKPAKGGGQVTVVRSPSLNQAVLVTQGLAPAPDGKTHELWLKHDNVYIPAGFLDTGDHVVLLDGDPASAQAFGLSVEPMTGSTEPSADIVALLDFTDA